MSKVVPKKPKPDAKPKTEAKKTAAKKVAVKKPAKAEKAVPQETGLTLVSKDTGLALPELTPAFVKQAQSKHAAFLKQNATVEKGVVSLGKMGLEMKDKAFFTAIKDGDGNFFKRSGDYFNEYMPGGVAKSQMFQAMRITRELVQGEAPVMTESEAESVPKTNLDGMVKLKDRNVDLEKPVKDKEGKSYANVAEAAKELPIDRFEKEIVLPNAPDLAQKQAARQGNTLPGPAVLMREVLELPSTLFAMKEKCMQIGSKLCADDDRTVPMKEKIWESMFANYIATYGAEYENAIEAEANQAQHTAQEVSANLPLEVEPVNAEVVEEVEPETEDVAPEVEALNMLPDDGDDDDLIVDEDEHYIELDDMPTEDDEE